MDISVRKKVLTPDLEFGVMSGELRDEADLERYIAGESDNYFQVFDGIFKNKCRIFLKQLDK